MTEQTATNKASTLFSGVTLVIGAICIVAAVFGLFWLSKIIPGLYSIMVENGYSFLTHSVIFHLLWLVFFLSLFISGVKLIISAINKRTTNLVPGLSLYYLGASLVVIGLFYIIIQEIVYAAITILVGVLCIYFEGTTEIT